MSVLQRNIELVGRDGGSSAGLIRLRVLGGGERAIRALGGLIAFWGLAALSVFIPVLHFVLVPGMLIMGVVVFFGRFATESLLDSATGPCPDCGEDQSMEVSGRWRPPMNALCGACRHDLVLRDPQSRPSVAATEDELAQTAAEDDAQTIADDQK